MNLDEMLGIDASDPTQRHAEVLVEADSKLLDALVSLRKASEKSQSEIGEAMGVSQSAVARIESGERDPHLSTLRRYALAVGALVTHDVRPVKKSLPVRTRDMTWTSGMVEHWDSGLRVPSGSRNP